jgi:hypothetical protein
MEAASPRLSVIYRMWYEVSPPSVERRYAPEHNPTQTRRRSLSRSGLDLEIREQVGRYLRGELSFVELQKWVARSSWRGYIAGDTGAAELMGAVELRLGEYATGFWSEEDLQRALHALVDASPSEP